MRLKEMLQKQKVFADKFYDSENMTESEKIEKHKTLCLAMHSEISQLADSVHYRDHRTRITPTHKQNILFETMDVYRYCLAILNLWEYDETEAVAAFESRDSHLLVRTHKNISNWSGEPVVVVDVDDVIARFRQNFYEWINRTYPESNVDHTSSEYFLSKPVSGKSGDELLQEFIDSGELRKLSVCQNVIDNLRLLRQSGYWIHILTARPDTELKCVNETYEWLEKYVKEFDSVQLSSEKYIAVAGLEPYKQGKIVCSIDDSPKHSSEYAMHGIPCLVPSRSYNQGVLESDGIYPFDWETGDITALVESIKTSLENN
jgi:phosphoglycolate phosphatase-like HAD superfamily hydrolase